MLEYFPIDIVTCLLVFIDFHEAWKLLALNKRHYKVLAYTSEFWRPIVQQLYKGLDMDQIGRYIAMNKTVKLSTNRKDYFYWKKKVEMVRSVFPYPFKLNDIVTRVLYRKALRLVKYFDIPILSAGQTAIECFKCKSNLIHSCVSCQLSKGQPRRCKFVMAECGHTFHQHCTLNPKIPNISSMDKGKTMHVYTTTDRHHNVNVHICKLLYKEPEHDKPTFKKYV